MSIVTYIGHIDLTCYIRLIEATIYILSFVYSVSDGAVCLIFYYLRSI